MIFLFSYQREEMLKSVLNDLKEENVVVLDDGSDFTINHSNVIRFKNGGKQKFWEKWFVAFRIAEGTDDDLFIFLQDDLKDINLKRIKEIHSKMNGAYVHHIVNDGRDWCWISKSSQPFDADSRQVFFTDCIFFCNRKALDAIKWKIKEVDMARFKNRRDISSGVGQQLTMTFNRFGVKMLKPIKSLAFHGDHESTMHKELRKQTPLISK